MQVQVISDVLIVLGLAILILFVSGRLRVSAVAGFLLIGALTGPEGLGLIGELQNVERLCKTGVALLLFIVGLELSMGRVWEARRSALIGGSFQVLAALAVTSIVGLLLGQPPGRSVFLGFLVSLSSAAIAFKLFQERRDGLQGKAPFAIMLFQGSIAVPMALLAPSLLAGASTMTILWALLKGVALIIAAVICAEWVFPRLLQQIGRMGSRELVHLAILAMGLVSGWLASCAGLPPALSAFLAGLVLSGSELGHDALGKLLSFRDVFASFFFTSLGMLVDPKVFISHAGTIVLLVLGIMALKAIVGGIATVILGYPLQGGVLTGLALSQIGEFSFVLSSTGVDQGLLSGSSYRVFLAVSALTMAATPSALKLAPRACDLIKRLPMPGRTHTAGANIAGKIPETDLLIIGFGVAGRNLTHSVEEAGIAYSIIDINPDLVRRERARGRPIFQGDATQGKVLDQSGLREAGMIAITISDPVTVRHVLASVRRLNPESYIVVRARTSSEIGALYDLGANKVVSDQFEVSLGTIRRVLGKFWNDPEKVQRFVSDARSDHYSMLRCVSENAMSLFVSSLKALDLPAPNTEIWVLHLKEGSSLEGRSLGQVKLREKYGVVLLGECADSQILANPGDDTRFFAGRVYILAGEKDNLARVKELFES
jgi:CPA2 family monovalent cation:H+ antiporter-2